MSVSRFRKVFSVGLVVMAAIAIGSVAVYQALVYRNDIKDSLSSKPELEPISEAEMEPVEKKEVLAEESDAEEETAAAPLAPVSESFPFGVTQGEDGADGPAALTPRTAGAREGNLLVTEPTTTQLTEDERIVIEYVNRIIMTYNNLAPGVDLQSFASCVSDVRIALKNIETCRTMAENGTNLMTQMESQADEMIEKGPLSVTSNLDQASTNKGIYLHSQEFRLYLARGKLAFKQADEFFAALDTDLFKKDTAELTVEESQQLQDRLLAVESVQEAAFEALKLFSETQLRL